MPEHDLEREKKIEALLKAVEEANLRDEEKAKIYIW